MASRRTVNPAIGVQVPGLELFFHRLNQYGYTAGMLRCVRCETKLFGKQSRFCGIACKNNFYVALSRRRMKAKAIAHMGGKCQKCGYNRCERALGFHHRDRTKKELSFNSGNTISWKRIEKELRKCVLLCANCHMEEEDALLKAA